MVRAAGQGHGRNDAATTDAQPRARCSSYAHDAMSVTRDSGSSSTRMFSSLLGSRTPRAACDQFFVVLKSLLLVGWRRGGSQLKNYDETRSDHGPVGNTWLCYILVTIDYATYL